MSTYLFDIGNVLLAFDFQPALSSLIGAKPKANALAQIIAKKDHFEAGKIEVPDYIDWASELLDFQGSHDEFKRAWTSIFTPIEGSWELARELHHKGHRLILFSNTNAIHAPYCLETYPDFSLFEHAAFSHELGAIKPNDAFYTSSIEQFDIDPSDTYYIDDLPENIEAGKKFGLNTHLYRQDKHHDLLEWVAQH
ncbi:HAD family hydrolase [Rubritalea marina]|uniref:HAD family hydrolase n=1 Tax=Rubritalea marina TaxID=361055 RepID=UPI000378A14F|nr:HAD family phosphatase [Rubritalea marina]